MKPYRHRCQATLPASKQKGRVLAKAPGPIPTKDNTNNIMDTNDQKIVAPKPGTTRWYQAKIADLTAERERLQAERDQAISNAEYMTSIADALSEHVDSLQPLRTALALSMVVLFPCVTYCLLHWFGGAR